MIDQYDFGKIKVDGRDFEHDVKIMRYKIVPWNNTEHHRITEQDLIDFVEFKPSVIVCGIGFNGLVLVTDDAMKFAEKNGIKLVIKPTTEAVKTYNDLMERKEKAAAIIHLTC